MVWTWADFFFDRRFVPGCFDAGTPVHVRSIGGPDVTRIHRELSPAANGRERIAFELDDRGSTDYDWWAQTCYGAIVEYGRFT